MYILDNLTLRTTYHHDFHLCLVQQDIYVSFVFFSVYMLPFHLNLLLCVLQTPWSVDFSCSIDHSRSLAPTNWHSRLCGLIFFYYIQTGNDVTSWRMSVGLFYAKAFGLFTRKTIGKLTFRFFLIPLLLKIIRKGIYRIGTFLQLSICNLETAVIISLLVLLFGDIEENPGPLNSEYCVSLLHCNIRSIRNKIDYIINTFCDFDILCFTETTIAFQLKILPYVINMTTPTVKIELTTVVEFWRMYPLT